MLGEITPYDTIQTVDEVSSRVPTRVNLDANANAPATPVVINAVVSALAKSANPSSAHAQGNDARSILVKARDEVTSLCDGVFDDSVVFTSGCTEANNIVLNSVRSSGATLLTTAVEHPSVLAPAGKLAAEGHRVVYLPVDRNGIVQLDRLEAELATRTGPVMLSIQTANGETGVVQPIERIGELASLRDDVLFHTDAAQSFGKRILALDARSGPHVASVSAHKLHGPMGVGALLLADGENRIPAMVHGGEQEGGRRAGTEAVAMIAGMGAACADRAIHLDRHTGLMRELRDRLEATVLAETPGTSVNGADVDRLPNTSSIRFDCMDAMQIVAGLDALGISVSQGSACSSMRPTPSPALLAMGLSEREAFSTVRFSISVLNTRADIDRALEALASIFRNGRPMR